MKAITIRELHARTGHWVRRAADFGEIWVTNNRRTVAKIVPETEREDRPYFARRKLSSAYKRLAASGKLRGGIDSTAAISEEREDRPL